MALPCALYCAAQVRALDATAIEQGTPGYTLMRRAGEAALQVLRSRWPTVLHFAVVAGGGNNAGDGYVLARFAQAAGLQPVVLAVVPPERLKDEARQACDDWQASGGQILPFEMAALESVELVVDALLGIGARAPLDDAHRQAVAAINAARKPVLALDLPSGLDADTGAEQDLAVRADCTISFVALKSGLFLGAGPELAGRLFFDDLQVQVPDTARFQPQLLRLDETLISQALPRRRREAHKGEFGRVLIIGGAVGMPGAVRLAGEAALRCGAGLVTVACAPENLPIVAAGRPELILLPLPDAAPLAAALQAAEIIAIGPGLGRSAWSRRVLERVLEANRPLIIDADALNLLAEAGRSAPPGSILTPHPGEAGRLLGRHGALVQKDRLAALDALLERHDATIVLKGAGTLVGRRGQVTALCERGNPAMAGPGMGDVLTGAIAGILGQCRDPWLAARAAVLVHAMAGDEMARVIGARGLLAGELAEELTRWVNLS
ncbi:MAG: NAD(P)H-hydrate dehydratase [Steroidobacteraceae bacterium]